ncbi:MAG: ribbon-helix-helix domain-containing protein [Candidatus Sulfotelmatobacter sp.]|jgi:hypothetical protein
MEKKKQQITLSIDPDQLQKLRDWSEKTMVPLAALLRRAIDETLETHKAEIKRG